jgi:hypothetical protein
VLLECHPLMVDCLPPASVCATEFCSATEADPQAATNAGAVVAVILVFLICPCALDARRRSRGGD